MGLADRVMRRFLVTTKLATINDQDTLKQLVLMEAESMADELSRDERKEVMRRVRVTPQVKEHARAWDAAVEHVLLDWCQKNMDSLNIGDGPLKSATTPADAVKVMMELRGGAGYLYFMEHEGHGVGTWDGDWDVLFKTPRPTIKTLSQHVLAATRQAYKGLKDVIFDAGLEAMPEEEMEKNAAHMTASAFNRDLAQAYADAWPEGSIAKLAPEVLQPEAIGQLLVSLWSQAGVGNKIRDLQFRSAQWMTPAEFGQQMKLICPAYNGFYAPRVAKWLSRFPGISIQPAREYSVCLYIKGDNEQLTAMAAQASAAVKAGEADIYPNGELRLWWD